MNTTRRNFLTSSVGALVGAGLAAGPNAPDAASAADTISAVSTESAPRTRNRVGAVAYGYQYSIGLFSYKDRPGERFEAVKFVEANHAAGGEVAQHEPLVGRAPPEPGTSLRLGHQADASSSLEACSDSPSSSSLATTSSRLF